MFKPEQHDVEKWFGYLNEKIFNDELPDFDEVVISRRRMIHAECILHNVNANGDMTIHLNINNNFKDITQFICVLGHEMVHMFQYLNADTGNHNKMFFSFRDLFEQHGLVLTRRY